MTNFVSSPMIAAFWAVAMTASASVASAAVWPSDASGFHAGNAGWNVPWRERGLSYVDDGFRAPLRNPMASSALENFDRLSESVLDRMYGTAPNSKGLGVAAAARSGVGSSGLGRGGNAGVAPGMAGDVGGGTGILPSTGFAPAPDAQTDRILPSTGFAPAPDAQMDRVAETPNSVLPVRQPGGRDTPSDTGEDASSLAVIPVPASAILMIAGLGVFIPVMRRRRVRPA